MSDGPDNDERPWERPGAVRRDCEPHRGTLLMFLGVMGVLVSGLGIVVFGLAVIGMLLGMMTYRLARRDLAKVRAGLMDPAGRRPVVQALDLARASIKAGAFGLAWSAIPWTVAALLHFRPWEW